MTYAIRVEGLGKRYTIGRAPTTLRDAFGKGLTAPIRAVKSGTGWRQRRSRDEIWALRDVSFEIAKGETVGIIGANGAGKSTLLRILSRITEPTEGRVLLSGVAGSLLEVGTGFHPELTGRENVYLNAAILGMKRIDIDRRFDDIVEFAGVERFIDTPVKHFSSGMQVRLAFSVAAHVDPEILIVDEVLAVGDADFQKKCLERMESIRTSGSTVLFVSHSMQAVVRICPRAVLLEDGRLVADGKAQDVIETYLPPEDATSTAEDEETPSPSEVEATGVREWASADEGPGDDLVRLRAVRVRSNGRITQHVDIRNPVEIDVEYWRLAEDPNFKPLVTLHFRNDEGTTLFVSSELSHRDIRERIRPRGLVRSTCSIPGNFLAEGRVFVSVMLNPLGESRARHVWEQNAISFVVLDTGLPDTVRGGIARGWPGIVRPLLSWTTTDEPALPTGSESAESK